MAIFAFIAALMSAGAVALVWRGLLASSPVASNASRRRANRLIHAAELDALDAELAHGRLSREAHAAARDELLRRLLDEAGPDAPVRSAPRLPGLVLALAVPVVAASLYLLVGNPAALSAAEAADPAQRLETHLRYSPGDGRAWIALARLHMDAGRYAAAVPAYERALASGAKIAADAQVWCELADALGMAQGGSLRGRPAELVAKALTLAPAHPRALEMAGSAAYEAGDFERTIASWSALHAQLDPDSSPARDLAVALERVRALAARR